MADLYGRTVIYTDEEEITSENVLDVLKKAEQTHVNNVSAINTLWDYYCGKQDIIYREKEIRSDILNIITENRAKEIVDFKTGYLCGNPIVYVTRNGDESSEDVARLNDYMQSEEKASKDKQLIDWQHIAGTCYRLVMPDTEMSEIVPEWEDDEAPFEIYTVEPRKAFVVYSSGVGNRPMMGVYRIIDSKEKVHYTCYTATEWFKVFDGKIEEQGTNGIGMIPIIEYPANEARLGAFEPVKSLLDAINEVDSNRVDGIEQFIQSLILLVNCDLPEGTTATSLLQSGLAQIRSTGDLKADIKILSEQLDQQQTQTLKDDMYNTILTICAMPSRSTRNFSGDTGIAVMYRDGWSAAETSAQASELTFKSAESRMLKCVLKICTDLNTLALKPSNVDIKFSRRNYEAIEAKANVLNMMLGNEKIDPRLAFAYSNMFSDPEEAYRSSMQWYESHQTSGSETAQNISQTDSVKSINAEVERTTIKTQE